MTDNQRYRPSNQTVDQFAERDILPKPMFPESIPARHQANRAGTGSNALEPKPRQSKDPRETALVEMIEMPRGIQGKPPTTEQLKFQAVHIGHTDDQQSVILEQSMHPT